MFTANVLKELDNKQVRSRQLHFNARTDIQVPRNTVTGANNALGNTATEKSKQYA